MMGIFHTNAIALKQMDKIKAKDLGRTTIILSSCSRS